MFDMRRRHFITLLSGAAVAWPLAATGALAQQLTKMPRIGFLSGAAGFEPQHEGFREGLRELGYVEGQNLSILWRWADGHYDLLPGLAAELVQREVALIVGQGQPGASAAKQVTSTIPIVMVGVRDPLGAGLITNLARPGGNVTGVALSPSRELTGKQLQLLKDLMPSLGRVALMWNSVNAAHLLMLDEIEAQARALSLRLDPVGVRTADDVDGAFAELVEKRADALFVLLDPVSLSRRDHIAALAAKRRLPTMFEVRQFVEVGGLMSYGVDYRAHYHRAALYVNKILKGAKPEDLPVEQPERIELVINLKTANALGLIIPRDLLLLADEVIE